MFLSFSSGVEPLRLYLSPRYRKTAFVWHTHLSPSTTYGRFAYNMCASFSGTEEASPALLSHRNSPSTHATLPLPILPSPCINQSEASGSTGLPSAPPPLLSVHEQIQGSVHKDQCIYRQTNGFISRIAGFRPLNHESISLYRVSLKSACHRSCGAAAGGDRRAEREG